MESAKRKIFLTCFPNVHRGRKTYKMVRIAFIVQAIQKSIRMGKPWSPPGVGRFFMFEDVDIYLKDLAKWTGQATDECERGLKLLRKVQKATTVIYVKEMTRGISDTEFEDQQLLKALLPSPWSLPKYEKAAMKCSVSYVNEVCDYYID